MSSFKYPLSTHCGHWAEGLLPTIADIRLNVSRARQAEANENSLTKLIAMWICGSP